MAAGLGERPASDAAFGEELRSATAANLAGWHDVAARALGLRTRLGADAWMSVDPIPVIFFDWIGLRGPADAPDARAIAAGVASGFPVGRRIAASDPWAALPLGEHGFERGWEQPWMVRAPAPVPAALTPPELRVEEVGTAQALAIHEAAGFAGFEAPVQPAHTFQAPAILADPRVRLWTGHVRGRPVATAMAFVDAGVLAIYGVSTIPDARRRGYATALTAVALAAAPHLPAVLQPSAMAEPLYARLGFSRFATFAMWLRRSTP